MSRRLLAFSAAALIALLALSFGIGRLTADDAPALAAPAALAEPPEAERQAVVDVPPLPPMGALPALREPPPAPEPRPTSPSTPPTFPSTPPAGPSTPPAGPSTPPAGPSTPPAGPSAPAPDPPAPAPGPSGGFGPDGEESGSS